MSQLPPVSTCMDQRRCCETFSTKARRNILYHFAAHERYNGFEGHLSNLGAFSMVAQWMQTRKVIEAWLLWLALDVFYVGMFLYKGLYPTAGLYAAFLYLASLGYIEWRRSMVEGPHRTTGAAA